MRHLRIAATAAVAASLWAGAALAATDLTGFWVLQADEAQVPQAASTPAATAKVEELLAARGLDAPNGSPEYARLWCTPDGMPYQMLHTLPIAFVQGTISLDMAFSTEAEPRHIYLDGQPHPDPDAYDKNVVGHSIGRWQGDTLVADTRYFAGGILVIPGGALRTENSRLTERFRLIDKDTLRVTSTWTDATTLRRPHTYVQTYKRAEGPVWMTESQCSPVRAMREKGYKVPYDAPG